MEGIGIKDVAERARALRALVADDEWIEDGQRAEEVRAEIHGLAFEIIGIPMSPKGEELSIEYRLARAEAERLHGSCRQFEFAFETHFGRRDRSFAKAALSHEGGNLFVSLGAFLAMAEGL